jgi:hypothetical protein
MSLHANRAHVQIPGSHVRGGTSGLPPSGSAGSRLLRLAAAGAKWRRLLRRRLREGGGVGERRNYEGSACVPPRKCERLDTCVRDRRMSSTPAEWVAEV